MKWADTKKRTGEEVTCVYCRSAWKTTAAPAKGKKGKKGVTNHEGYVNMANLQGMSLQRGKQHKQRILKEQIIHHTTGMMIMVTVTVMDIEIVGDFCNINWYVNKHL